MLLKLPLLLFLLAQSTAENVFEAYRQIPDRVPIVPNQILNRTLPVKSLEQCKETCLSQGRLDFIYSKEFYHSKDMMGCTCLPKYLWYRHGLVFSKNADLFIYSARDTTLNNFLFLDAPPTPDSRLYTDHLTKTSVEECALKCFNYIHAEAQVCYAFLFDIVSGECLLYSNSHLRIGGFEEEKFFNGVNKLYFEKLSQFEQYFNPMPRTRLANGWAPEKVPGKRLEECSKLCVLKADCLAFNYIPKMLQCELLRQTRDDTVNMKPDLQSIHFEMIPNHDCGNGRSDARWALIRSPGWPKQLSKKYMNRSSCKWDILTPWGLTVKLNSSFFKLEHLGSDCLQSLRIGEQKPVCTTSPQLYKQTSEVTTFNFSVEQWPQPTKDLAKRIGFLMTYSLDWTINSEMRDTGVIACPGFPKPMHPSINTWKIVTNKPNQKVLIEFQDFNMKEYDLQSDKGYLQFIQKGKIIKECKGEHLQPACDKSMTFFGELLLEFHSGLHPKNEYPPGFKLIYTVGDARSSLKPLNGTEIMIMKNEKIMINETDVQKRYKSVDRIIKIKNPDKNGRVALRILNLHLSLADEANLCSQDSLRVVDPSSKYVNFIFCGQTTPQETINSLGNELHVIVKVDALPFTDKFKPERTFVIAANKKKIIPQEVISIEEEGSISITESEYLPHKDIKWVVTGNEMQEPTVIFRHANLAEFRFLDQRFCDNDRLSIQHGSEFTSSCGHDQSLSNRAFYTNNNEIGITFQSDDIISGPGFLADIEMITTQRCKPGEVLQVTANETDYLMSQNYPGIQNSKLPCFWQLVAENSTGVFINVLEGEMFLSTTEPDEEKPTLQAGRKTLHVPTDTILSWSGGTKGKFLATIENLDLTTTMAPTTTETATSTPEIPTTEAPTSPTTTDTVLPPDFNKQIKENPVPKIGGGIAAALVAVIVLCLIVWRVRANRHEIIEAPGKFVNSDLFQRPDEIIQNYGKQTSFDNPAYVDNPQMFNGFNSLEESEYAVMQGAAVDDREFSHLSSNVNSMYGTSNPYEEYAP